MKNLKQLKRILDDVERYLLENYEDEMVLTWERNICSIPVESRNLACKLDTQSVFDDLEPTFSNQLMSFIDKSGKTDAEIYKKANIDRKLFSKIRSNVDYSPRKRTVIALAFALELSPSDADTLLRSAGYALSPATKFDVIIEYFFKNKIYDLFTVNEVLLHYDQVPLV